MHAEAQNLVATCSNCLSLVVGFLGDTSRIPGSWPPKGPRTSNSDAVAPEPRGAKAFKRKWFIPMRFQTRKSRVNFPKPGVLHEQGRTARSPFKSENPWKRNHEGDGGYGS